MVISVYMHKLSSQDAPRYIPYKPTISFLVLVFVLPLGKGRQVHLVLVNPIALKSSIFLGILAAIVIYES